MTLAIGMYCADGIVMAADTRITFEDGSISDIKKVEVLSTDHGQFAFAQSADDANAATSLVSEIKASISAKEPTSFQAIEATVKDVMRGWYPVDQNRPTVQLLLGACLPEEIFPHELYFCEPPVTVTRILESYKAIGGGWVITDPIYKHWLNGGIKTLHESLCQISYLMYKGKQLLPRDVGGHTDAVFISSAIAPYHIERLSMDVAESYGQMFDRNIKKLVSLALSGNAGEAETVLATAADIHQIALNYSRLEFKCWFPDVTIRRSA